MRGKLQKELPWLHWTWWYAHRLELACKDALSSQLFKDIEDKCYSTSTISMASQQRSPVEQADIVEDIKEVWEFSAGGDKPVRSQSSCWISHKRKALQRLVDRYGGYLNHVTALSEDQTIRSTDRARLKGYLKTWKQSKMLIGAAMYVDVLKSPSFLSLSLQKEKLDIVLAIQHVLKSSKSLKTMVGQDLLLWSTVKLVYSRVKDEDGNKIYQGCYS